jgi:hypothetical protein
MTNKPTTPHDTKQQAEVAHPGMMGDGTEEQNLNQRGNPAVRIKKDAVRPERVFPARGWRRLQSVQRQFQACTHGQQRMFRRSGYRFADKNMRPCMTLEHGPIPQERDML